MPSHLEFVPIEEIATLQRGTEPGRKAYRKAGDISFLRVSDITGSRPSGIFISKSTKHVSVEPEDTLLALDGTPGAVARGLSGAISSGIRKVKPVDPKAVDNDYLFHVLQCTRVQKIIEDFKPGITIKHASKALKKIFIPIPPLNVQRSIASKLNRIEEMNQQLSSFEREVADFRSVLLNHYVSPDVAKRKGWPIVQLGSPDACDEIYRYPTFYGIKFTKKGVPVAKISNFSNLDQFEPDMGAYDYITEEISNRYPRTILKRGDLVMEVRGTYIGRIVPVPSFLEGGNISPNLIRISPNRDKIRPRFLWHISCSEWWKSQLSEIIHFWKSKFGTVRSGQLRMVEVPLPDKQTQDDLLEKLDGGVAIVKEASVVAAECRELYQIVLDDEFGKLWQQTTANPS